MQVFLSHSSMNKTNVKAIVAYLPKQIRTWLDENNLIWGSPLEETFESVIKSEVDYVIVFLSGGRKNNAWVLKELTWALDHEKQINRNFVLPVIMPGLDIDPYLEYPEIKGIKYIELDNYEETGFKSCAEKITTQLFSLIITDLENMHKPKTENVTKALQKTESFLDELCKTVYSIVFNHRESNPITVEELYEKLAEKKFAEFDKEEFPEFLNKLCTRLSGIYYDGYELYLTEEHSLWKNSIKSESKLAIAYAASKHIRNGLTIFIDAGSTMSQLVDILCRRIETHAINGLNIITVSTEHVSKIADTCARLGYDQYSAPVKVYVPGGFVRPNTKAIVGINGQNLVEQIVNAIGRLDIAFIGANAAKAGAGIYTHNNDELYVKHQIAEFAQKTYYTFDDSKCGLQLEEKLADFEDNIKVIINDNPENEDLQKIIAQYPDKIEIARKVLR